MEADFTGADLTGVTLRNLRLDQARLARACFHAANLFACNLEEVEMPGADFRGAALMGSYLTGSIMPGATFRATIEAVYDLAVALRDEGPLAEERFAARFAGHPLGDLHTFAGFDRIREWEAQYLPPEELEKYDGSIGHQPTRA